MAAPGHYGPHATVTADVLPEWQQNTGTRFGVVGKDDWKVTPLTSLVRGIQFNTGAGWSDGVYSVYDSTNITAPYSLPVTSETKYFMIVSRADWQEPFTRVFTHVEGTADRALPLNAVDYYRNVGVRADFPVALVQVPANSLDLGEIIDLRVRRGDNGWLIAHSELVKQYLDRDGTVVEINGELHRRKDGLWDVVGRTDEASPMIFRSLVMNGSMTLPNNTYTTIHKMRAHTSDRTPGISFSGGVATVNVPGLYVMEGQVSFPGEALAADRGMRAVSFTVDPGGANYLHRTYGGSDASTRTVTAKHTQYFEAGSKVALQAWQGTGRNMTLGDSVDGTRWNIRRVAR